MSAATISLEGMGLRDLADLPSHGDVFMIWRMEDGTIDATRYPAFVGLPACATALGWLPLQEAPAAMHENMRLWLYPMRMIQQRKRVLVFWKSDRGDLAQAVAMTAEEVSLAKYRDLQAWIEPIGWLPLMAVEVCE